MDLAKSFERRKCNHKQVIPGDECIAALVGKPLLFSDACGSDILAGDSNKHRYVIATQLRALRVKLRVIPAVPLVHVNRAVMILEPPSDATLDAKQQVCPLLRYQVFTHYRDLDRRTGISTYRCGAGYYSK